MKPTKKIIFSYQLLSNIGCEIIIRGSIAFLTRAYPNYNLKFFVSSYHAERDRDLLRDLPNVTIIPMLEWKRIARGVLIKTKLNRFFWTPRFASKYFKNADLFVSIGGDIYTMFGDRLPRDWLGYERYATHHGIPSIMFGANMERFEILNEAERKELLAHLKCFKLIAVRDVGTQEYLKKFGITENVDVFPDPIFSLRPQTELHTGPIKRVGMNISPILLRDYGPEIIKHYANIVTALVREGYEIHLIPHVYSSDRNPSLDDRLTLQELYTSLPAEVQDRTGLYDGNMSFTDMAREIYSVDAFIGARMHACLNAVTQGKPTFFLGYSSKAATMTSWLTETSPFSVFKSSIATKMANDVSSDDILTFLAAQSLPLSSKALPPIQTAEFLSHSPIWNHLCQVAPLTNT